MMARLTNEQLLALLAAISTVISNALQLLNVCASIQLLLLDEYRKNQVAIQTLVVERNKGARRYIRQRERYMNRCRRRHWVNPGRTHYFHVVFEFPVRFF